MIKYNSNNINGWYFEDSDIIKVYRNNAVCYYKQVVAGGVTSQTPCYAVVNDISQYSDTEFEDVYNKADSKWYKLNNLNQYEEYGVYGNSRNITYYDGKLTIDDGYEYMYSGSSWVNVGATSGTSRVPAGYVELEYIECPQNRYAMIDTGFKPNQDTRVVAEMQMVTNQAYARWWGAGHWNWTNNDRGWQFDYETNITGTLHISWGTTQGWKTYNKNGDYNRHKFDWNKHTFTIDDDFTVTDTSSASFQCTSNLGIFNKYSTGQTLQNNEHLWGKLFYFQLYDNDILIRDLIPAKRESDNMIGCYDAVNDEFLYSNTISAYTKNTFYQFTGGAEVSHVVYPLYYDEKSAPPNNLSFSSMTEAEQYECPYVGMKATIEGQRYVFSGNSTSGYEWVAQSNTIISPLYLERTASQNGYVGLGEYFQENTTIEIKFQMTQAKGNTIIGDYGTNDRDDWRVFLNYDRQTNNLLVYDFINDTRLTYNTGNWAKMFHLEIGNYYIKDLDTGTVLINTTAKTGFTRPNQMYLFHMDGGQITNNIDYGQIYFVKIKQDGVLVKDLIPWTDGEGNYGLYDKVADEIHYSTGQMTGSSEWNYVDVYSLPAVPYSLNYNAKQYIASGFTIPQTLGQLQNVNAVCNYGYNIVDHSADGYISITGNTRMIISGNNGTYLNRNNTESGAAMTIISKAVNAWPNSNSYSLLTNRRSGQWQSNLNWMYRQYNNNVKLHGVIADASIACSTSEPNIIATRTYYDNGSVKVYYNNYTQGISTQPEAFEYNGNGAITNGGALFCDYVNNNDEFFIGDFYWIYMSQSVLTDEQIQKVINFNENL